MKKQEILAMVCCIYVAAEMNWNKAGIRKTYVVNIKTNQLWPLLMFPLVCLFVRLFVRSLFVRSFVCCFVAFLLRFSCWFPMSQCHSYVWWHPRVASPWQRVETILPPIDVLFPLVGWLIEGFEETPLTIGKWWSMVYQTGPSIFTKRTLSLPPLELKASHRCNALGGQRRSRRSRQLDGDGFIPTGLDG